MKPMGRYILYGSSNIVTGETRSLFSAARSVSTLQQIKRPILLKRTFYCILVVASRQSIANQIIRRQQKLGRF